MRASEFIKNEEKLDEVLPLIGLAAKGIGGALARGAAKGIGGALARGAATGAAGAVGRGLGQAAVKGVGAVAKGAVKSLAGSDDDEEEPNDPNATVGVQPTTPAAKSTTTGAPSTPATATKSGSVTTDLKPGTNIQMPTTTGQVGNFKVTRVTANDVEIENPDKLKNPNEPDRVIYNKQDLAKAMGTK